MAVLVGCTSTNPVQTETKYQSSDGVDIDVANLELRNILIISPGQGDAGVLLGSVINSGDAVATVDIEGADGSFSARVEAPAGEPVRLGPDDGGTVVEIASTPAAPGEFVQVTVRSDGESAEDAIPVLDGSLEQYRPYLPAGASDSSNL